MDITIKKIKVGKEGLPGYFGDKTISHLRDLQEEAILYLEGHRGQGSLFDDEDREPRNVTPEDSPTRLVAITGGSIKQIAG